MPQPAWRSPMPDPPGDHPDCAYWRLTASQCANYHARLAKVRGLAGRADAPGLVVEWPAVVAGAALAVVAGRAVVGHLGWW